MHLFTIPRCSSGVFYVGFIYPTAVDELCLPFIQSAALADFAYCMFTEQILVLVFFRDLSKATMCLSLGFVNSHAACLLPVHLLQLSACHTEGHFPPLSPARLSLVNWVNSKTICVPQV